MSHSLFPKKHDDVIALTEKMIGDFKKYPEIFPSPPITPEELEKVVDQAKEKMEKIADLRAAMTTEVKEQDKIFSNMEDGMRSDLRFAENVTSDASNADAAKALKAENKAFEALMDAYENRNELCRA